MAEIFKSLCNTTISRLEKSLDLIKRLTKCISSFIWKILATVKTIKLYEYRSLSDSSKL
jgi:hypothetical protein